MVNGFSYRDLPASEQILYRRRSATSQRRMLEEHAALRDMAHNNRLGDAKDELEANVYTLPLPITVRNGLGYQISVDCNGQLSEATHVPPPAGLYWYRVARPVVAFGLDQDPRFLAEYCYFVGDWALIPGGTPYFVGAAQQQLTMAAPATNGGQQVNVTAAQQLPPPQQPPMAFTAADQQFYDHAAAASQQSLLASFAEYQQSDALQQEIEASDAADKEAQRFDSGVNPGL